MGRALHETAQAAALARLVQENSPEQVGRAIPEPGVVLVR